MSLSKPRAPYKNLSFDEKIAVIREVEKGLKKKCIIAKEYGIAPNTLSTFLKNKDKILKCNLNRKRAREPENPDVDECVLKWFKQTREKNIPLSGTLVRAKAEEFAVSLGKNNFKASSGWLDGFKERNGISFKTVCGESSSVDQDAANEWKKKTLLKSLRIRKTKTFLMLTKLDFFSNVLLQKLWPLKVKNVVEGNIVKTV